jgi:hypothetical protein
MRKKKKKPYRKQKWVKHQLTLFPSGEQLRDQGIAQALEHADRDTPRWSSIAYEFLCKFAQTHEGEFMAEYVRAASRGIIPPPPDERAWGGVFTKAYRAGVIRSVRYERCVSPELHRVPKIVWIKNSNNGNKTAN